MDACPHRVECGNSSTIYGSTSIAVGAGPAVVSIVSSTLSCIGSLLIVYTYLRWKDLRTGSRSVITFLAIADFFTALGYVLGSANYIVRWFADNGDGPSECPVFTMICTIQSFVTTWSTMSSFLWTSFLAFYLYLTLVKSRLILATRLIPWFHCVAWGLPIAICLPLLIKGHLGFAPYTASTWCFIYDDQHADQHLTSREIGIILAGGKLWEILTYGVVMILYTAIKRHIWKETRLGKSEQYISSGLVAVVQKADRKFTFIPVVFILLRIWGTIQFFYSIIVSRSVTHYNECVSYAVSIGFLILGYLQAIGDGGQGWGNVILYIFTSEKIRKRLFGWMLVMCVHDSKQVDHPRLPILHGSKKQYNKIYAAINNFPATVNNPAISAANAMVHYTLEHAHVNDREPLTEFSYEPTTDFNAPSSDDS